MTDARKVALAIYDLIDEMIIGSTNEAEADVEHFLVRLEETLLETKVIF